MLRIINVTRTVVTVLRVLFTVRIVQFYTSETAIRKIRQIRLRNLYYVSTRPVLRTFAVGHILFFVFIMFINI